MPKPSAGLLMFRKRGPDLEVLLVHPGGPYWATKDEGVWSIPKGEYEKEEDPLEAAKREFFEETGLTARGPFQSLATLKQPSGKKITAWAFEGDCDPSNVTSNLFKMEWPPGSGKRLDFPEIDRAAWFDLETATGKLSKGQVGFIEELRRVLADQAQPNPAGP